MNRTEEVVVKIGGSLLRGGNIAERVETYCRSLGDASVWMIVGGGGLIDAVRQLDSLRSLQPIANHWRCVDLLDATFEIAGEWFPFASAIADEPRLKTELLDRGNAIRLVRVGCFYRPDRTFGLPRDWTTTTDAIAVAFASHIGCSRVTLLKSCEVPPSSLDQLAQDGIIDGATPSASRRMGISVDLQRLP